jgi:TPP-dependent pyruvate/acetoin dehydrogenase alpha subunit
LEISELIEFEAKCAEAFNAGLIRAPCHLSGGNEAQLIEIFKDIRPQDWVLSTYRWHYHALLKGIPQEWVMEQIMASKGMNIGNVENRFLTSAIVGGLLPVAIGIAAGIKRNGGDERVWVFCGDMASTTGACWESTFYAEGHDLPVTFVVENNAMGCNSPTLDCWGKSDSEKIMIYKYDRKWPHVGAGKWVAF